MKRKLVSILTISFIIISLIIQNVSFSTETQSGNKENEQTSEIIVSDTTMITAATTIEDSQNGTDLSTEETVEITEDEIETDITTNQDTSTDYNEEEISGDGIEKILGAYQGLTYYSQADYRWADILYTSTNDETQTIKSSGCGPTACAMVVTASKGTILPPTMASLFVDNGYRTANSGTSWSAMQFTADYFGFEEYYTTTDYTTAMNYLQNGYYIIASCGNGLFTTSGHFIFLTGVSNSTISIYDSYLYDGKFETTSRKVANVTVSGETVKVSKTNFKKYANVKQYFIFSNDKGSGNAKKITATKTYNRYVYVSSILNVRSGPGTNYKKVSTLKKNKKVTVYETENGWSRIGADKWVKSSYLKTYKYTVGNTKKIKATTLYSKKTLSGKKYKYKSGTKVKVLKNISSTVDYVKVVGTNKKLYIKISKYK